MLCIDWIRGFSYLVLLCAIPIGLVPYLLCTALLQHFGCFAQLVSLLLSLTSHQGYWSPLLTPTVIPSLCVFRYSISSEVLCSGLSLLTGKQCACASCSLHDSTFIITFPTACASTARPSSLRALCRLQNGIKLEPSGFSVFLYNLRWYHCRGMKRWKCLESP